MDLCRWWGKDLEWWAAQPRELQIQYLAHWNIRHEEKT